MLLNQVENHSSQEREAEYSGVVNLSSRHLKRIECLPKGISPSTLLLSNNEISKVENLQYFVHVQQLSLAGNHIVDIKGISAALGLRVLDLSDNSIITIEGVGSLRNLEWLNLSGNSIEQIENLDRNPNLTHLDLSDNSITVLSGLRTLKKLKTLLLHGNLISSLAVIKDQVSNTVCTLSLADNEISDLNEVSYLSSLINLEQLSLLNNPCVLASGSWRLEVNYRSYLVYCCGNLRNLDGQLVNNQERMLARLLDQAFSRVGHPSLGQHVQLVSILHHICSEPTDVTQATQADVGDDHDCNKLLESESFYIPVPLSDVDQTESDDPIMTEEEAIRLLSLAATIIQAHVRGHLVRKTFDFCQYRRRKYAAACIQAVWKGYRARTRDIKVVNIRNELRVRRLISLINNLYAALEREHEDSVKSREQLKTAIKYLWHQITEQKRLNQIQLHKEIVKAAIKIQAWWRGCLAKKAFPQKRVNRDQVTILFALCRKLQMQLDVVTSQIKEITTKGEKQSKESQQGEQTDSEEQDNFYDTVGQLDLSQDNIAPLPDGDVNHAATHTCSPTVHQLDAALGKPAAHPLGDVQDKTAGGNNMSVSGQIVPLDSKVNKMVQSSAGQMDYKEYEMASSNPRHMDLGLNKITSSIDLEEDDLAFSAVTEKEEESSSYLGHTEHNDNGVTSQVTHSTQDHVELQLENRVLPLATQEEPRDQTEARASDAQTDQLEENIAPRVVESQLPDEAPSWEAAEEDTLHVSIPEIIVSSPVPTDDESSDVESGVEGDANEEQREAESSSVERQDIADGQAHADSSWKFPSFHQENECHISEADTMTDQTKDSTCFRQEGDIPDSYLVPLTSTTEYLASTEVSETHGEEAIAAQSGRAASQGSVPNLGERASSLLSQLRSEIASMKTARLGSASPIITTDSDGNTTEMENTNGITSQERDTFQPASQQHDTSQSESQQRGTSQPASQERDTSQPASQQRDTSQPAAQERDTSQPALQERDTSQAASQQRDTSQPAAQERDTSQAAPQQRDTSQPASQERDTSQAAPQQRDTGPVSAVTYRLPLFEDVDSTCTSFSLDDIL